jgi:hypothetical protein
MSAELKPASRMGEVVVAVACAPRDLPSLRAAFAPRGEVEEPPVELVRLLRLERVEEAGEALDQWLGHRRLVAGIVNPSEAELRALGHPSDRTLEMAMLAIRSAFSWTRLLADRMALGGGGTIVLPMPRQRGGSAAGEVVAFGLLGLARSRSMSRVPRVRCNAVVRAAGDQETFARIVSTLAAPELSWLSGCLLGTSRHEVTLFGRDQPSWQVFDPPGQEPPTGGRSLITSAGASHAGAPHLARRRPAFERPAWRRGPPH